MPKYRVQGYSGDPEEVIADNVADAGHEGHWLDFTRANASGGQTLVLRLRAGDVLRVEEVRE